MKTISFYPSSKRKGDNPNLLHVETELGIVNIWVGLTDRKGRKVETITFIPDDRYIGESTVRQIPKTGVRFVQLKKRRRH